MMNEANKGDAAPAAQQASKSFTSAALKFATVIVLVIAIYYASAWASYTFFSTVG